MRDVDADAPIRDLIARNDLDGALKRLEQLRADALASLDVEELEQVRDLTLGVRMQGTGRIRERAERLSRSVDSDLQFLGSGREIRPAAVGQSVATAQPFDRLEPKERRQVVQAVMHGRVVDDPKLAPVAIVRAQELLDAAGEGWSLWRPCDWPSLLRAYRKQRITGWWTPILLLVGYVPLLLAVTQRLSVVLPLVGTHLALNAWVLEKFAREAPLRAQQSKTANLHLREDLRGRPRR